MTLSNQSILFRVNGIDFQNFQSINIRKSLIDFNGGYSLKYTDRDGNGALFKGNDLIEIIVNGETYLKGYVSENVGNIENNRHIIETFGQERTIDLVQSSLTENIEFQNSVKMIDVVKKVLLSLGMDTVKVITDLDIKPFEGGEIVSGEMGDNAFAFLEKYSRKRQLVLITNPDGNIELQRANFNFDGDILQLIEQNETNNVLSSSFKENFDNRFNQYTCKCADNLSFGDLNPDFVDRVGIATDSEIRASRKLEIIMDSSSIDTLKKRAVWEKNMRLNGGVYTCRVQGFASNTQNLYYPNMNLIQVNDDVQKINKQMLLRDVSLTLSNAGSFSDLILVDPIAYSNLEDYKYNFEEGSIIRR